MIIIYCDTMYIMFHSLDIESGKHKGAEQSITECETEGKVL